MARSTSNPEPPPPPNESSTPKNPTSATILPLGAQCSLTLLAEARESGLKVSANGDQLVMRGPKSASHIAEVLMSRKQEIMDKMSGAKTECPGLAKCLETLQSGDILVVWRLDRLGRSMRYLITLVEDLRTRSIGFRSLNEGAIDTTTASGELIFHVFSVLAQFERRLIQERTLGWLPHMPVAATAGVPK